LQTGTMSSGLFLCLISLAYVFVPLDFRPRKLALTANLTATLWLVVGMLGLGRQPFSGKSLQNTPYLVNVVLRSLAKNLIISQVI
jgi:hypothetical protein